MTTNFQKVKVFMETFGQEVKTNIELPDKQTQKLRVRLIQEELTELIQALAVNDEVEVADALTDILYVTYGAGHAFGVDLDACFKEVQESNMSKLGEDGKPVYRADGKVQKGPNYWKPDLSKILYKEPNG